MWYAIKRSTELVAGTIWSYDETFAAAGQPADGPTEDMIVGNVYPDALVLHFQCTDIVGAGNIYCYPKLHEQWGTEVLLRPGVTFKTTTGVLALALTGAGTGTNIIDAAVDNSGAMLFKLLDDSAAPLFHEKFYFEPVNNGMTSGRIRMRWEWLAQK